MTTRKTISDLQDILFEQLSKVTSQDCDMAVEQPKSQTVVQLSAQLINAGKLELGFMQFQADMGERKPFSSTPEFFKSIDTATPKKQKSKQVG